MTRRKKLSDEYGVVAHEFGFNFYQNWDYPEARIEINLSLGSGLDFDEMRAINEQMECQFGMGPA